MTEFEVPQAAVDAVLNHSWEAGLKPYDMHSHHDFNGGCAVCRGDVTAVLAVAAPHIAAAVLCQAAEEHMPAGKVLGQPCAVCGTGWPCRAYARLHKRAYALVPGVPDTRESILAAAGLTEADMWEGTDG